MTTFEKAEQEYYSSPDDKEYNYCQCCERIECKIFNGKYICEDCEIEQQNETEENL
jgi:hypothetical protein